jgi:hypothetical protein
MVASKYQGGRRWFRSSGSSGVANLDSELLSCELFARRDVSNYIQRHRALSCLSVSQSGSMSCSGWHDSPLHPRRLEGRTTPRIHPGIESELTYTVQLATMCYIPLRVRLHVPQPSKLPVVVICCTSLSYSKYAQESFRMPVRSRCPGTREVLRQYALPMSHQILPCPHRITQRGINPTPP